MRFLFRLMLALSCALVPAVSAQEATDGFSALARVDSSQSAVRDARRGGVQIDLALSQGVPWRIFTLDDPRRLVLDFREIDWRGVVAADLLQTDRIAAIRMGGLRPGWSRMVMDLASPMQIEAAEMRLNTLEGSAQLSAILIATDAESFAAAAGAPADPRWDLPEPARDIKPPAPKPDWAPTVVMIDPGHGGIDPGAERDGLQEKDLMLTLARELRDTLRRAGGFDVHLTRDDDQFVSLDGRVALAHAQGADVFISLHADMLQQGHAHGATVYTLSDAASDKASQFLAERHDRDNVLAGTDLSGTDDLIANVLLDLARQETTPRSERLATAMVLGMQGTVGKLNSKPNRRAGFSVLKAADIPSVLIEVGFMSSDRDFANLQDADWRARVAEGVRDGLQAWVIADRAARDLVRQ
ncbi:N-acetylmuramoyl-L-alanine amidase [Cognatishimia sp. SS12]|uniref:N-acetylmuramoyl-L-alanine amidase n=1 Tax=Cognatishimia sp. SS12 TaxID=2979465 RepID=UPI00232C1CC8|nr:N-acetylmuramoyl-L-alanine amidase [Cognatishimia sp. SS12]MDC0737206.1 N-acetylmuramoyl-L-alanine amidase [Cognatishimia sp. SS12]